MIPKRAIYYLDAAPLTKPLTIYWSIWLNPKTSILETDQISKNNPKEKKWLTKTLTSFLPLIRVKNINRKNCKKIGRIHQIHVKMDPLNSVLIKTISRMFVLSRRQSTLRKKILLINKQRKSLFLKEFLQNPIHFNTKTFIIGHFNTSKPIKHFSLTQQTIKNIATFKIYKK